MYNQNDEELSILNLHKILKMNEMWTLVNESVVIDIKLECVL